MNAPESTPFWYLSTPSSESGADNDDDIYMPDRDEPGVVDVDDGDEVVEVPRSTPRPVAGSLVKGFSITIKASTPWFFWTWT